MFTKDVKKTVIFGDIKEEISFAANKPCMIKPTLLGKFKTEA